MSISTVIDKGPIIASIHSMSLRHGLYDMVRRVGAVNELVEEVVVLGVEYITGNIEEVDIGIADFMVMLDEFYPNEVDALDMGDAHKAFYHLLCVGERHWGKELVCVSVRELAGIIHHNDRIMELVTEDLIYDPIE